MKRFSKYAALGSLVVLIAVMAVATVVEKVMNTSYVAQCVYGSLWFVALWMWCVAWSLVYGWLVRRTLRWPVVMLHAAWVVILCGAFLTHVWGRRGTLHCVKASRFRCMPTGGDIPRRCRLRSCSSGFP